MPRVVVTGIGVVCPLGPDRESTWQQLREGQGAVRWLPRLGFAGAPSGVTIPEGEEPVVALAIRAAHEAVRDAFGSRSCPPEAGCVIGTSKGGLRSFAASCGRPAAPLPVFEQGFPNAAAASVAATWGLIGPVLCPVAACATGLISLIRGADLIRERTCQVVLAGSTDASLEPIILASYRRLGVLSPATAESARAACRPFSGDRAGFAIGEGAAVLVLESLESALARGSRIHAEWLGDSLAADPTHLTQLEPEPHSLTWLVRSALARAGIEPPEVDYVNYHGTATAANDAHETRAIRAAFGSAAREVSGSSLKGALGHMLGAAGSVETAMTILAMRDGTVPPTINLHTPDPACDLDYTPGRSRKRRVQTALKLSLGFGGHLAAAVLRSVDVGRDETPPS